MLTFNGSLKVYVALKPCDMRKSFDGLAAAARNTIQVEPSSGAAFLFTNRSRNLIKIVSEGNAAPHEISRRLRHQP
mgnify:CR=1 FL=1